MFAVPIIIEQSRAEQSRAEQSRAEQSRACKDKIENYCLNLDTPDLGVYGIFNSQQSVVLLLRWVDFSKHNNVPVLNSLLKLEFSSGQRIHLSANKPLHWLNNFHSQLNKRRKSMKKAFISDSSYHSCCGPRPALQETLLNLKKFWRE